MGEAPARPMTGEPGRWRSRVSYGLLAVCSAAKVNVAVVVAFW